MKTAMKLLMNALIVVVLICASCKKDNLEDAVLAESLETEQSVQGESGTVDTDGTNGTDGTDGESGSDGADGTDGADGNDGSNGEDGEDGQNGTDGEDGQDGQDGAQGPVGPKGDTGDTGPAGPKGDTGDTGPKGDDGEDGNANVIASRWYSANFGSFTLNKAFGEIKAPDISQTVLNTYIILGYVAASENPGQVYPMPWKDPLLGSIEFSYSAKKGWFNVHVERFISGTTISPNWRFRYVLVAPSSIAGKGYTIDSLQKMSYQEAMQALGLNE